MLGFGLSLELFYFLTLSFFDPGQRVFYDGITTSVDLLWNGNWTKELREKEHKS